MFAARTDEEVLDALIATHMDNEITSFFCSEHVRLNAHVLRRLRGDAEIEGSKFLEGKHNNYSKSKALETLLKYKELLCG